jgi:hypothetical protein
MTIQQNVIKKCKTEDFYSNIISGYDMHSRMFDFHGVQNNLTLFLQQIQIMTRNAVTTCSSYYLGDSISEFLLEQDYSTRCAMAINVKIEDYYYLVKRSDAIYISDVQFINKLTWGN